MRCRVSYGTCQICHLCFTWFQTMCSLENKITTKTYLLSSDNVLFYFILQHIDFLMFMFCLACNMFQNIQPKAPGPHPSLNVKFMTTLQSNRTIRKVTHKIDDLFVNNSAKTAKNGVSCHSNQSSYPIRNKNTTRTVRESITIVMFVL